MFARSSVRCARSSTRKAHLEGTSARVRLSCAGNGFLADRAQSADSRRTRSATALFSTNPTPRAAFQERDGGRKRSGKLQAPGWIRAPLRARGRRNEPLPREHPCALVADLEQALLGTSSFTLLSERDLEIMGIMNRLEPISSREVGPKDGGAMGYRKELCRLNAIASDMITRRQKLPTDFCLHNITVAIKCRSTPAMLFYLKRMEKTSGASFGWMVKSIMSWIDGDDFEGHNGPRNRKVLLTLLTGYPTGSPDGVNTRVTPNVLGLMESPGDWKMGRNLLIILRELGGAPALTAAWNETFNTWCTKEGRQAVSNSRDVKSGPQKDLLEVMVNELCQAYPPGFDMAWELAEPYLDDQEAFSDSTLENLLRSPESIDKHGGVRPHMEAILKQVMEKSVDQIEREMGIAWDASTGRHTTTDPEMEEILHDIDYAASGETPSLPEESDESSQSSSENALHGGTMHEAVDSLERQRQDRLVKRRVRRIEYDKRLLDEDTSME